MPKLNQIIAVASGRKAQAKTAIEAVYHSVQKDALFSGLTRTYQPKDENGEPLPGESKGVQVTVADAIDKATGAWAPLLEVVAALDYANCKAVADVKTDDGEFNMAGVPVTHLLFLEHQLTDLATFVGKLPTLDPAYVWNWDQNAACYRSAPQETARTKKVPKAFVKCEATKEHPAQVEVFHEDILAGTWRQTLFSGAIPATVKADYLARVRRLQEAVKMAREQANQIEAPKANNGRAIFDYVFKSV